jgi:prefoldin subunit 5
MIDFNPPLQPVDRLDRAVCGLRETCDYLRRDIERGEENIAKLRNEIAQHEIAIAEYLAAIEKLNA